jgi:hypothetical protein
MSKPKNNSTPAPPPAPTPQNAYYYQNDQLKSQSVFDKGLNAYVNKSFSTPQEQGIQNQATNYISDLVGKLPQQMNLSPEQLNQYASDYSAPQIAALNDSYNQAKGQATQAAAGHGMLNSVGFGNYTANQIEKNRAQGLADIAANAQMQKYDLPNKVLMPYANTFNLINAALNGEQSNIQQNLQPSTQGVVNANNIANQNFANQMNQWNAQMQNQQNQGRGGLFSFFTGG